MPFRAKISDFKIDGKKVDPMFGIAFDGRLVEVLTGSIWDTKERVWTEPPSGTPGWYHLDSMPLSQEEVWKYMADLQCSRNLGFVDMILERLKNFEPYEPYDLDDPRLKETN